MLDPDDKEAAIERVRLNSIGAVEELLRAEGGSVSVSTFAAATGISRETVARFWKAGRVIAWEDEAIGLQYPTWQIHNGGILRGLGSVLEMLARRQALLSSVAQIDYFLSKSEALGGRRPLDLLRAGEDAIVLDHARHYGESGA
jgi:hypothetical protein